jgi:hypothetical protein
MGGGGHLIQKVEKGEGSTEGATRIRVSDTGLLGPQEYSSPAVLKQRLLTAMREGQLSFLLS